MLFVCQFEPHNSDLWYYCGYVDSDYIWLCGVLWSFKTFEYFYKCTVAEGLRGWSFVY